MLLGQACELPQGQVQNPLIVVVDNPHKIFAGELASALHHLCKEQRPVDEDCDLDWYEDGPSLTS
eukprot:8564883-Alexandrium_andersonii.AAC.1